MVYNQRKKKKLNIEHSKSEDTCINYNKYLVIKINK